MSKEGANKPKGESAQNFFIFMQFSGKIYQMICWHQALLPTSEVVAPPLGNPGSATKTFPYNFDKSRGAPPHYKITIYFWKKWTK